MKAAGFAAGIAALLISASIAPRQADAAAPAAPDVLVELGLRYEHAEGVPRDYDRALALYCEASARGSAKGAYNIAVMRLNGRGIERSDRKAVYWLRLAETRSHEHASLLLRRLRAEPESDRALCLRAAAKNRARASAAAPLPVPADISALVDRLAPEFELDPALVRAVIAVESGYRVDAVSPKNAQGLMQLIPGTAARFGVEDPFDPVQNVRGGMKYLRFLLRLFGGDVTLALAAYNAGERAVLAHGGVPPYPETTLYLEKLRRYYDRAYHPVSLDGASR